MKYLLKRRKDDKNKDDGGTPSAAGSNFSNAAATTSPSVVAPGTATSSSSSTAAAAVVLPLSSSHENTAAVSAVLRRSSGDVDDSVAVPIIAPPHPTTTTTTTTALPLKPDGPAAADAPPVANPPGLLVPVHGGIAKNRTRSPTARSRVAVGDRNPEAGAAAAGPTTTTTSGPSWAPTAAGAGSAAPSSAFPSNSSGSSVVVVDGGPVILMAPPNALGGGGNGEAAAAAAAAVGPAAAAAAAEAASLLEKMEVEDMQRWTELTTEMAAAGASAAAGGDPSESSNSGGEPQMIALAMKKMQLCQVLYDFRNPTAFLLGKEKKKIVLLELVDLAGSSCIFSANEQLVKGMISLISVNIFRPLPPTHADAAGASTATSAAVSLETDDEEPFLEPAWPHLQVVYELFLRFVVNEDVDSKSVKKYIDQQFILNLLELFSSEDPRERDYLKTILHRIYGKIMAMRSFIRRAIQNLFFRCIYEHKYDTVSHRGISELLEILGSIINGFALPLKEEHRGFLRASLLPLHKTRFLQNFHQQLTYCMTQYVEKDARLVEYIVLGLLRYWPITNTTKEVIFLNEIEEILELTQPAEFQKIMIPLFMRLATCIESPHFQVSERVLFLWNNEYIVQLFNGHKEKLFPLVISSLYKNSKEHWNSTVHGLTYNVSKLLADADPNLFDNCSDSNLHKSEKSQKEREEANAKWAALEQKYGGRPAGAPTTTNTTPTAATTANGHR